jgi:N-acetyl-anhydromuramyl-L-alanine amidase AmpD
MFGARPPFFAGPGALFARRRPAAHSGNAMLFATSPLVIIDRPADNRHMDAGRVAYDYVILHHTGGIDSVKWLSTTSDPPVSCHRLIARDGRIFKLVPDDHVAYTQGPARIGPLPSPTVNLNHYALSIEFENLGNGEQWPDAQLRAGAMQIVEWWGAYGFLPVLYHKQVQSDKHDPFGFPRQRFDRFLAEQLKATL